MKRTLKISIATLLIAFVGTLSLLAFTPKHQPAAKESKKFADDAFFTYSPATGGITNANNWTATTSGLCPGTGAAQLCGISFDDTQTGYSLTSGKPNSNILSQVNSNIATIIAAGNHIGTITYLSSTITVYLK